MSAPSPDVVAAARALVARTTKAQRLPRLVRDAVAIAAVADIAAPAVEERAGSEKSTRARRPRRGAA